MLRIVAHLSGK